MNGLLVRIMQEMVPDGCFAFGTVLNAARSSPGPSVVADTALMVVHIAGWLDVSPPPPRMANHPFRRSHIQLCVQEQDGASVSYVETYGPGPSVALSCTTN